MKKGIPGLMLFVLFTMACSLSGILPKNNANASKALQYIFEIPTDPVSVTVTLENETQTGALIPAAGGSLSVTGADGTLFRLDIPASALATDTYVSMIPVSKVDGMPFGSFMDAVQLEPDGLQLNDFAILTITPPQPLPVDQQIFFGYQGLGKNLTLVPPVLDSQEIKLQLLHFSGYGVSRGLLADTQAARARIGGDAEARLTSAVAEQLARMRQSQLMSLDSSEQVDWQNAFTQFEEQVIQPRITAAGESCANGRLALETILVVEHQRQLLGIGRGGILMQNLMTPNGLMDTVANVCMKEEYQLCRDEHIIHRIVAAWRSLKRQYDLLAPAGSSPPAALEAAKTYVRQCLTFELRLQSQMNLTDSSGFVTSSTVESKVKLQVDTNAVELKLSGHAPLVNTAFDFQFPGCTSVSGRGGGTFEVVSLDAITGVRSPTDELGYVRDLTLKYYPGTTSETASITCGNAPTVSMPGPFWTMGFVNAHQGEMVGSTGTFLADNWQILGNALYASKEWTKDNGSGIIEMGSFKLYHIPGQ
jgi:hypothetical protein